VAEDVVERFVSSLGFIRELLLPMDELADPIMGVADWDDAVCVEFGGKKLVVSVDGPYAKRLVLKSALVHASTDVVVKGARPLFALDTLIGRKLEVEEMLGALRVQALSLGVPLLGGNTLFEDVEPRANLTVVGELVVGGPIRDCGAKAGDCLALLGEPIWGEPDERLSKAKTLFGAWYAALDSGVKINAAKDVTKGGLVCAVYEMESKSGNCFRLDEELPYPVGRNLDNFLLSLPEAQYAKLRKIAHDFGCPLAEIGAVC